MAETIQLCVSHQLIQNVKLLNNIICLLEEPDSHYLGHAVPSSGSSANIFEAIREFLTENNIFTDSLVAICCDGTAVNIGKHGGIIRLLKFQVNQPHLWFICVFHFNELFR